MSLSIQAFEVSPFAENTYVVHDGTEAALIDPGTATRAERELVTEFLETRKLRVRHLLLTHGHVDHVFGCAHFAHRYGEAADFGGWQMHPDDLPLLQNARTQGELFGVRVDEPPTPTRALSPGDSVDLGGRTFTVLHAPGHSPGSVCFYCEAEGFVIAGDVLFKGSVGRTDLWGGDTDTLIRSIREQLLTLPDETVVYPGHGPATTVGAERRTNPFLVP